MQYKGIALLLEKFKSILARGAEEKEYILKSIHDATAVRVPESSIKIQGTILHIAVSGTKKTAIILKKQEILDAINKGRARPLTDIR